MKRNRRKLKIMGVLLAVTGAVIVVRMTPLFIWYILLAGLVIILALAILKG